MSNYTALYFNYDEYHKHKVKIKRNIFSKYGLVWNYSKGSVVEVEQIKDVYNLFNISDHIDDNLKGRGGSSGLWQNRYNTVKLLTFDKKSDDEHLPVLMIVIGDKTQLYKDLINYCLNVISCEVIEISKDENDEFNEISRKKINVELINGMNDKKKEKELLKKMFITKIDYLRDINYYFSDSFVNKWLKLIDN